MTTIEPAKNSRPPARPWTSDEENKLRNMLDAGKTADEIAVELKRTRLVPRHRDYDSLATRG
jgi:hypothetical protein